MEEKKFDPYQFIGFILIALILTWMLYRNGPEEVPNAGAVQTEQPVVMPSIPQAVQDSLQQQQKIIAYGDLGGLFVPKDFPNVSFSTENMTLELQTQGGGIHKLVLQEFENYEDSPIPMVQNGNVDFNITLNTRDGRALNTRDFYFTPTLTEQDDAFVVSMRAALSESQYVAYEYVFPKTGYLFTVHFKTEGMEGLLDQNQPPKVSWTTDVYRNSRSIDYENRYTEYTFGYEEDRVDYLSLSGEDQETREGIRWISYRQHFFSAILIPDTPIVTADLKSKDLSSEESLEEKFTKRFETTYTLPSQSGNVNTQFEFYYGPTDYKTLQNLEGDLEASIPMGWGIFGWINRVIFLPLFGFLSSFLSYGIAIIVMTIIVRLAMSPVTYKSYVSQIKMKVLRPDVEAITAKYKDDAVKRQQETMSLYSRAGASPMSGCVPALIQLPIFYALFSFFPVAFVLRDKSFLWADDLSSYDSVLDLGFSIPFYGDHVSLFPILASIAIFFYTKMTTGQQPMPQQPGMPNMKIIMYLMPLMMLFFFNNYASGLSLYYFVSNLLTIFLMLIIKNYIIDDSKIHAKIEENKKKPKKAGGFSARLQKAMEEAEKQKKARGK
ncbi:membrane protein insertase YidC [Flavobacteriaceae bacterium]|jgi:YidC/Oxa1 family membrane protein insertase|nr:membrane protein insertase YidC [Flavobacteriaceae bacterium]MDA9851220.1 membrane protein insertase YidC [Flavobacteriaceae bacterium]MDC0872247.1 membrane protein insertase YidC [Flavobacteriaceae bacterium]